MYIWIHIFFFFNLWSILSYIEMKQPWVYMCSPSRSPLPPPSPPVPSRFSQCTRSEHLSHASSLGWCSVSPQIIHMFQCSSLETSHPRLLPQSLKDCSINLCLFFFFSVLHIGLSLTSFLCVIYSASQVIQVVNPPVNAGDAGDECSIPGLGRSPEVGNGNPLHYSCLDNPMDRGAWRATTK